jgi:hypothetical protein
MPVPSGQTKNFPDASAKRSLCFKPAARSRRTTRTEMKAFLTHLAVDRQVSASTQNQAKATLSYLSMQMLGEDLPDGDF